MSETAHTPGLPAPRLQLRWRKPTARELVRRGCIGQANRWTCDYELVLPLDERDIRRTKRKPELIVRLSRTFMTNGGRLPIDAPFRDGAHASWDSKALSGLPVFVIGGDGTVRKQPNRAPVAT